jgi:hypothetical protein
MRRPRAVLRAGPYRVVSLANGDLTVRASWPEFLPWDPEEGGGPGVLSRLDLAGELQRWLNAPWDPK